ncbi:hypothetical protein EHQ94_01880 [Leptospira meyeri]|uniref:hypothetical protein n=1 Tax=Leptospira meyeri TaxID=29508 RepID=UPI001082F145|nr:hypothetical protein [Leptospira meyeri]TGM62948.1 hypothetical protein EHQ93_11580 [Leptospira meyeri]TGM73538.1 hypothetical protein EHQ94_01880 [Leptospira meyeri]
MNINYLTIKVLDINKSKELYESFGLILVLEKHGNGPEHYSIQFENSILEIYPWNKIEIVDFNTIRLGFSVSNILEYFDKIESICKKFSLAFKYSQELKKIEIKDFENRTLEIFESK